MGQPRAKTGAKLRPNRANIGRQQQQQQQQGTNKHWDPVLSIYVFLSLPLRVQTNTGTPSLLFTGAPSQQQQQQHIPLSTVLYSARGESGASRPLYYTVPEDDPELPVHCITQCQKEDPELPVHCITQCQKEDPELPVHCIVQCQRRIRSFPSTVLYSARGRSGASCPL